MPGGAHLVHRYYDPATGQFLSVDPEVDSTNEPYSYASGDPVDGTDPTGLVRRPLPTTKYKKDCHNCQWDLGGRLTLAVRFSPAEGMQWGFNGRALSSADAVAELVGPGVPGGFELQERLNYDKGTRTPHASFPPSFFRTHGLYRLTVLYSFTANHTIIPYILSADEHWDGEKTCKMDA